MSQYRLELWFNFDANATQQGWGVVKNPQSGNPQVLEVVDNKVTISDGNISSLDVVVFDASTSGSHSLDWVQVDFEIAPDSQPGQGDDPISDAIGLRDGLTGAEFDEDGPTASMSIYSYPGGTRTSLQGWENTDAFETLNDGNFTFTVTLKSTPAGANQPQKVFSIDPEIDIDNGGG